MLSGMCELASLKSVCSMAGTGPICQWSLVNVSVLVHPLPLWFTPPRGKLPLCWNWIQRHLGGPVRLPCAFTLVLRHTHWPRPLPPHCLYNDGYASVFTSLWVIMWPGGGGGRGQRIHTTKSVGFVPPSYSAQPLSVIPRLIVIKL
jgi:hypothetical protein